MTLKQKIFENIEGGENAGYQHFLLFPQFFQSYQKQNQTRAANCRKIGPSYPKL